jgi:hypothetical protein
VACGPWRRWGRRVGQNAQCECDEVVDSQQSWLCCRARVGCSPLCCIASSSYLLQSLPSAQPSKCSSNRKAQGWQNNAVVAASLPRGHPRCLPTANCPLGHSAAGFALPRACVATIDLAFPVRCAGLAWAARRSTTRALGLCWLGRAVRCSECPPSVSATKAWRRRVQLHYCCWRVCPGLACP